MLIIAILIIAAFSIGLSFFSLHNLKKMNEVLDAKKDLKKHRVVFQKDSSMPSSE